VVDVPSERDIGLAWLSGRELPPLSARFRDHILRLTHLTNSYLRGT
jgi:hypothetical protein